MKIILFIGPHRAGKSTILSLLAARVPAAIRIDLDEEIAKHCDCRVTEAFCRLGPSRFSLLSGEIVKALEERNCTEIGLVAVGAGSIQNIAIAEGWLHQHSVITLTGDPSILYQRASRECHPSLDHYISVEFSDSRKRLYSEADFIAQVDQSTPDQTASEILAFIQSQQAGNEPETNQREHCTAHPPRVRRRDH